MCNCIFASGAVHIRRQTPSEQTAVSRLVAGTACTGSAVMNQLAWRRPSALYYETSAWGPGRHLCWRGGKGAGQQARAQPLEEGSLRVV